MWNIFEDGHILCHKTASTNFKAEYLKDKLFIFKIDVI